MFKRRSVIRGKGVLAAALAIGAVAAMTYIGAAESSRHVRNRFWVVQDSEVARVETPPHDGRGKSTAYRYFDDVPDQRVIFRKRALHQGAAIGMHVLEHDEVYYVVSGRGVLKVDDTQREVGPDTAIFMHEGADVGLEQRGAENLVVIVSYPPKTQRSAAP
jgi:mannose-6-phosphate isomerase-like protein (cupin superfamily)